MADKSGLAENTVLEILKSACALFFVRFFINIGKKTKKDLNE